MPPSTIDLTGPDWEPDPSIAWFAQCDDKYAFGPDPHAALAALLALLKSRAEVASWVALAEAVAPTP